MCQTILISFGCYDQPLPDHNNTCRYYPNYLSPCFHARSMNRPCKIQDIRPLYILTALECPSCLSKWQKYSPTMGTHVFALNESSYDALRRWLEHKLKLTPVRWPGRTLEKLVQTWGSKSVPDEEAGRRKLQCVEQALEFYQQVTQRSAGKGPKSRVQVVGDGIGEVGKDGAGGVKQMGALQFRWVDGETEQALRIEGNGVNAEEFASLGNGDETSDEVVGNADDEQTAPSEVQASELLTLGSTISEETTEGTVLHAWTTADNPSYYDNYFTGIEENLEGAVIRPHTRRLAFQRTQITVPSEGTSSWSSPPIDLANNQISQNRLLELIPRSDPQWWPETSSNGPVHWGYQSLLQGPTHAFSISSSHDSEYHFMTRIDEPAPCSLGAIIDGVRVQSGQFALGPTTHDIAAPDNLFTGTDDMHTGPKCFQMDPENNLDMFLHMQSTPEGNGVIEQTISSPGDLPMPFEAHQPSNSIGIRQLTLTEKIRNTYIPLPPEEQPRRSSRARRPMRHFTPTDHGGAVPVEPRSQSSSSGANRNVPIDPTLFGQPAAQSGSMAPLIPKMSSQRPQTTPTQGAIGPSRKRKTDDPGEPDESLTAKRSRG